MTVLKTAICQINPAIGGFEDTLEQIKSHYETACSQGADMAVFAEMSICGYFIGDLTRKKSFVQDCETALQQVAKFTKGKDTLILIGCIAQSDTDKPYNSVFMIENGVITAQRSKQHMADESSCQDSRIFTPAPAQDCITVKGITIGLPICNDVWVDYVCADLKQKGAEVLISFNASPFYYGKLNNRHRAMQCHTNALGIGCIYTNDIGGYDSVLTDGGSFALNYNGEIVLQAPQFKTGVYMVDICKDDVTGTVDIANGDIYPVTGFYETLWNASVFGLQQYAIRSGFTKAVLGLSGGIDSAIVCAIAVQALGLENVRTVMMPSPYTSQESLDDAKDCADLLGVAYDIISIEPAMGAFESMLAPVMNGTTADTTEENIQARIRGNIIMALSNKFGSLALTTGNKSEIAVGYSTLYGDMCGGFNPIKDIYKTDVFELCKWVNTQKKSIPENIISKPPTAELRPNQKDSDSLPPYDILDSILKNMIEQDLSIEEIIAKGFDTETVRRIWRLLHVSEYKRQQSAPGVKLTATDFENDRKYYITTAYTHYALEKDKKVK